MQLGKGQARFLLNNENIHESNDCHSVKYFKTPDIPELIICLLDIFNEEKISNRQWYYTNRTLMYALARR
jgi:hypothetical protein